MSKKGRNFQNFQNLTSYSDSPYSNQSRWKISPSKLNFYFYLDFGQMWANFEHLRANIFFLSKSDLVQIPHPQIKSRWKFSICKLNFYFSARFGSNLGTFWACPGKIWSEFTKCSIIYLIIMKLSLPESFLQIRSLLSKLFP